MHGRWIVGGLAITLLVSAPRLEAQLPRPLIPLPDEGLRVTPTFDGWYKNADGTVSLSFGYSNLNKDLVEIPIGPDNFIVPKEYDGRQPTSFPPVAPDPQDGGGAAPVVGAAPGAAGAAGGGGGNATNRRDRARGVFAITVPASYKGDVVWTLRYHGQTWSAPGRSKSVNYQLSWPMAMGSVPPLLRFLANGPAGRGPAGIQAAPQQTRVGVPLPLTVWLIDDAVREEEPVVIKTRVVAPPANVTWQKHAGPAGAPIDFDPAKSPFTETAGTSTTRATFKEPGEYVIRVKADTFGRVDSSSGNQCCWTNGYVKVTVTR